MKVKSYHNNYSKLHFWLKTFVHVVENKNNQLVSNKQEFALNRFVFPVMGMVMYDNVPGNFVIVSHSRRVS